MGTENGPPNSQSTQADRPKGSPVGQKGYTGNPGGRPKVLREIEAMLNAEHRTVDNMREVFGRLKALALGQVVTIRAKDGSELRLELQAEPGFMKLYLERILGPVKDLDDLDKLMEDAPREVREWIAEHFN